MIARALLPVALVALWAATALALDINPDRPDLTTSADLVPAGALQIETGVEYQRARVAGAPAERQLSLQAVLRAGVTEALEVSLEGAPFVWLRDEGEHAGSGDYTLGLKYRLYTPAEGSALPAVSL